MKSFQMIFGPDGKVVVYNVQGADGLKCIEVTQPYVDELQDKGDPGSALMILDPEYAPLATNETVEEDG